MGLIPYSVNMFYTNSTGNSPESCGIFTETNSLLGEQVRADVGENDNGISDLKRRILFVDLLPEHFDPAGDFDSGDHPPVHPGII